MKKNKIIIALAIVAVLMLAACGGGATNDPPAQTGGTQTGGTQTNAPPAQTGSAPETPTPTPEPEEIQEQDPTPQAPPPHPPEIGMIELHGLTSDSATIFLMASPIHEDMRGFYALNDDIIDTTGAGMVMGTRPGWGYYFTITGLTVDVRTVSIQIKDTHGQVSEVGNLEIFNGEPPVFPSNFWNDVSNPGYLAVALGYTSNTSSTVYYLVVPAGSPTPDEATIRSTGKHGFLRQNHRRFTFNLMNITGQSVDIHFFLENPAGMSEINMHSLIY